jgi:hypothetical protein
MWQKKRDLRQSVVSLSDMWVKYEEVLTAVVYVSLLLLSHGHMT